MTITKCDQCFKVSYNSPLSEDPPDLCESCFFDAVEEFVKVARRERLAIHRSQEAVA